MPTPKEDKQPKAYVLLQNHLHIPYPMSGNALHLSSCTQHHGFLSWKDVKLNIMMINVWVSKLLGFRAAEQRVDKYMVSTVKDELLSVEIYSWNWVFNNV